MSKKGSKKGSISGDGSSKLTKKEAELVSLILDEDLTPKQLSLRRGFSHSYSCRIFRNLQKKGVLNKVQKKVQLRGLGLEHKRGVRLHGERWKIKIIYKDERYAKTLKKSNTITIDRNTVKLYEDVILVYSNNSFFAEDAEGATVKALNYWNRFFVRLENDLDVILVKGRSHNIKRYRQEYALVNNALARKCNDVGDKIRVRDRGDGRVWFEIDNSLNLHEAETKHPVRAELDMKDVVEPLFNNFMDFHANTGDSFNPLQTMKFIDFIIKDRALYAENIKSHVEAIQLMSLKLGELSDMMEDVKKGRGV